MMHPWMIEQVAEEHRRDLLDLACRTPAVRKPRLRKRLPRPSRRA